MTDKRTFMRLVAQERARLQRSATWELRNMVKALSLHSWLNDTNERARLEAANLVLNSRRKGLAPPSSEDIIASMHDRDTWRGN